MMTCLTPASFIRVFVHSCAVAPVVKTSSTRMMVEPCNPASSDLRIRKAPRRLVSRCLRLSLVWVEVALFKLLNAKESIGVELTESCAMHPGSAVCGLYLSHPGSHYFQINDLQKDQVEDYAQRKNTSIDETERWLGPWLGF